MSTTPHQPARTATKNRAVVTAATGTKRTLSSWQTLLPKFVMPGLWLALMLVLLFSTALDVLLQAPHSGMPAMTTVLKFAAVTAFLLWGSTLFKVVRVDARNLYVTRFSRVVTVPLEQIARVNQNTTGRSPHVTVEFTAPTAVGSSVSFLPNTRLFWSITRQWRIGEEHPVVAELRDLAAAARRAAASQKPTDGTAAHA